MGETGLFDLPLALGNWTLVALWIFPIWWWWRREKKRIDVIPSEKQMPEKEAAYTLWNTRKWMLASISILLAVVFIWALPQWFLHNAAAGRGHTGTIADNSHEAMMNDGEHVMDGAMMSGSEHARHTPSYHEETDVTTGLAVSLAADSAIVSGEPTTLTFFVHTRPNNEPYDELTISHEKFLHVVGVRDDLGEFLHIHPEKVGDGFWRAPYIFIEPGNYKIYVDVVDARGTPHTFGQNILVISLGKDSLGTRTPISADFFSNVIVGQYQIAIAHDTPLVAGKTSNMQFTVHDVYGNGVELDNYLGTTMHLAAISRDLTQYVHTHPAEHAHDAPAGNVPDVPGFDESMPHTHSFLGAEIAYAHTESTGPEIASEPVSFQVPFAQPGIYRVFAQFRPKGANLGQDEAVVAAFFVNVEEDRGQTVTKPPPIVHDQVDATIPMSPQTQKILLVLASLVLMALLSRFVYKKIQVQ